MFKIVLAITLMTVCSQAVSARDNNAGIRRIDAEPEVDTFIDIGNRQFRINRVGRGKLGNQVLSGDTHNGDSMTIVQTENGEFAGNVLVDGKNFRVMPNGELRRAGRIKKNDLVVRQEDPNPAYDRMTAGDDVGIVDRWHNPGWQNMIRDAKGNYYGFWGYTDSNNRSITYVDVFAYIDNKIPNHKAFLDAEFALANQILQRSKVYIRLNLVGYKSINLPVEKASTTISKMDDMMGPFTDLATQQSRTGADLVTTFASTDTRRDMCGVAFLGGYKGRWDYRDGRSVVVCHGGESFVHEIAHNFGSDHDDSNAGSGFHFWHSMGFNKRNQQGWDEVSTVMSYGNAEVGVFSNPDLNCKGEPCGVEEQADNARSLNETRRWVAAYNGAGSCTSNCGENDDNTITNDKDNDGISDLYDACPNTPLGTEVDTSGCPVYGGGTDDGTDTNTDSDGDSILDSSDNCPNTYNPSQIDTDRDGLGDVCDSTPDGDATPTMSALMDISTHGGICARSRTSKTDYKTTFRGFENNSTSGSIWAVCPITRGNNTGTIAAEITILPITNTAANYNIQCDLVEIYEGNVEETISLSVNPQTTNTGESTHVFDPVAVKDRFSSSFAIECQVPRGYAITGIRQVSGN